MMDFKDYFAQRRNLGQVPPPQPPLKPQKPMGINAPVPIQPVQPQQQQPAQNYPLQQQGNQWGQQVNPYMQMMQQLMGMGGALQGAPQQPRGMFPQMGMGGGMPGFPPRRNQRGPVMPGFPPMDNQQNPYLPPIATPLTRF